MTAFALAGFALGIPGYVLVKVLQPGYFARENTKTPMLIAGVTVIVNIVFSLILFGPLGHIGIAISTSISAWVNVTLLMYGLKNFWKPDNRLKFRLPRILMASLIMGLSIGIINQYLEGMFGQEFWLRITGLLILLVSGTAIYFLAVIKLKASSLKELKEEFRKS